MSVMKKGITLFKYNAPAYAEARTVRAARSVTRSKFCYKDTERIG